ncbi:hypothetical protein ACROYT_G041519 [Oculina patagonica]
MEELCFLSYTSKYKGSCGNSRGITELVRLGDCNDSVVNHLTSCHLSRENLTEHELILARAGVFELPPSKASEMFICPKHRHSLGKYWKQRRPCQYPTHRGGKKAIKSRDVINVRMAKEIMKLHGVVVPIGSGWASKKAATAAFTTYDWSPLTPRASARAQSDVAWTPRLCVEQDYKDSESESESEEAANENTPVVFFNLAMENLAEEAGKKHSDPLEYQLKSWDDCSDVEKKTFVYKAKEACQLVCDVIAPRDGEKLFEAVQQQQNVSAASDTGLQALVAAYKRAPSKALKTQILSIYANRFTYKELKAIHQPFENLSDRQIKKARAHVTSQGPGMPVTKIPHHRVRIDQRQLDHFLEFTSRPYFYQDVAFGSRKIKLESGQELEMPNVVRTVARCTIIAQYLDFCKEDNFNPMSRATMWRVLEVQEASQRKSLTGLDNTAADGAEGFQALSKILDELEEVGADKEWCSQVRKRLQEGKLYLKTTYRDHCLEESKCPDHCRAFALSDANDADYRTVCDHNHDLGCLDCEALKDVIQEIQFSISQYSSHISNKEKEGDLRYDADAAQEKIMAWKAHVMRAQQQEEAKQNVLLSLQEDKVFVIVDWAMKFIQMKFREKQSEWFAKRGISWHLCSVIIRRREKLEVTSYAHLINSCNQDWFAVLSILENLMSLIKRSNPGIAKAYLRSDEAGCYHNSSLMASLKDLGGRHGIEVLRYDHSEPQHGKDVCDRILCPMKAAIRRYCNEGHDVVTAQDMHTALMERPVRGTTASVCCIDEANATLQIKKVTNYSSLHNFEFSPAGLRVWKAFKIENGKLVPWDSIILSSQGATGLKEDKPFFPTTARDMNITDKQKDACDESGVCFECPDPQCAEEFQSRSELDIHLNVIAHHNPAEPASISLYDKVRIDWVQRFQSISLDTRKQPGLENEAEVAAVTITVSNLLQMGWALHKPHKKTRFSEKVCDYLKRKFDIGQDTGRKEDPAQVSNDMRKARNPDGSRKFTRSEWLSKTQIQGFFSRLAAKRKQSGVQDVNSEGEDSDDLDDDVEEEYACQLDEQLLQETSEAVVAAIGVKHPAMYDVYNLREMVKENKLFSFKVKMLREISNYFDIQTKARDSKSVLVQKLKEMVLDCSCLGN